MPNDRITELPNYRTETRAADTKLLPNYCRITKLPKYRTEARVTDTKLQNYRITE